MPGSSGLRHAFPKTRYIARLADPDTGVAPPYIASGSGDARAGDSFHAEARATWAAGPCASSGFRRTQNPCLTARARAEFQDKVPGLRDKPAAPVRTGEGGLRAWRAGPELDAWITFESWHRAAGAETDFVPLPGGIGVARPAVIAVTRWTPRRMRALEFISFLRALMPMRCSVHGDGGSPGLCVISCARLAAPSRIRSAAASLRGRFTQPRPQGQRRSKMCEVFMQGGPGQCRAGWPGR